MSCCAPSVWRITEFPSFASSPEASPKFSSKSLSLCQCETMSIQNIRVSSTKRQCVAYFSCIILMPWNSPRWKMPLIFILRPPITKINSKGDSAHPCRRPLPTSKNIDGFPLINTTISHFVTQPRIHSMFEYSYRS